MHIQEAVNRNNPIDQENSSAVVRMIERELNSFFGKGQITGNRKNRINYNFKDGYRLRVVVSDTAKPEQGIIIDKAQGQRRSRVRLDKTKFTTQSLMDRIKQLCYTGRNGPYSKMNNIGPKKEGVYEAINTLENALNENLGRSLSMAPEDMKKEVKALFKILGAPSAVRGKSVVYNVGNKGESLTVTKGMTKYRIKLKRMTAGGKLKATMHDLSSLMQLMRFAKNFKKGR